MAFRSPSMLDQLGPNLDRNEARLLEQRRHLLSAVAASAIVDCGQLDDLGACCLQLAIPSGARQGLILRPPRNCAHGASWDGELQAAGAQVIQLPAVDN